MELKRTFEKGVMNKDFDERLVPNGFFRHAENVITDSTEGSDVGVIKNILSNKKVTNIDLGNNPKTLFCFSDETERKLYYWLVSNTGTFLIEYDDDLQAAFVLLHDSRSAKVLDLNESFRITSARKIYNDDKSKNLLIWTNNDMEICCINIERSKSFGINGFEKEDIYLIKKTPTNAPSITFTNSANESNEIEEKFISFATRYKYLDGEYSALSPFTNYNFIPKAFEIDFETLHNKSMQNIFNSVNIKFDTGDKRVTDIQIIAKFSNSTTLYIVETFNKEKEGFNDNSFSSLIYNNKKLYAALPEKELNRTFDNVPRKAKSLTLIGNRIILGNYTEGYNFIDNENQKIKIDYSLDIVSNEVNEEEKIISTFAQVDGYGRMIFNTPLSGQIANVEIALLGIGFKYLTGGKFELFIDIINNKSKQKVFSNRFTNILEGSYTSLGLYLRSNAFKEFIEQINAYMQNNWLDESLPGDISIIEYPFIEIVREAGKTYLKLHPLRFVDETLGYSEEYVFTSNSELVYNKISSPTSLKSFMDYEVGVVYQDEFKRSSTVQTTKNNTLFIPFENSRTQNKLKVSISNKPPYWAKYYRYAIKAKPLQYETIYINRFYTENGYTWAKLEGDNKQKVKENDILLVKRIANGIMSKPIKIKVLDVVTKESDFIKGNKDISGNDIIEEAGLYMKIKPIDFSMNLNDYQIRQDREIGQISGTGNYPLVYVDLFSTKSENVSVKHFELPLGSVITLYIKSSNKPDDGWKDNTLNKTYYVTDNYPTLAQWFIENITSVQGLFGNEGNATESYSGKIEVLKGYVTYQPMVGPVFTPSNDGLYYLKVTGTKPGMTNKRNGYLEVSLNVRTSDGFYVFETQPKKDVDLDIYYLNSETFEIENGKHLGNKANQTDLSPAISELSFFNCYTFGNGVESYKVRDGFNENYLNIDYTPCTTTIEEYKETVRTSDLTWGNVYNESSNINGLNEFNTSSLNWKELDKQNGEIRVLHSREGNLLVIQEDKWGQVLFGKNAIYSADGNATITTTNDVLRDYMPYAGTYGITDIESFISVANRTYAVDKKRGTVLRLSIDGLSEINSGMNHWFKSTLQDRIKSNVIAGFDPFYDTYNITIDEKNVKIPVLNCGQTFNKFNLKETFKYVLQLNGNSGTIFFNYNITNGAVNIKITDWNDWNYNNLTGQGQLEFPNGFNADRLTIEITPITDSADFQITNNCPLGNELAIRTLVITSMSDVELVFSKSLSINNGIKYRDDLVLNASNYAENSTINGYEGIGKFPKNGDLVKLTCYNDSISTKHFNSELGHDVKYLLSSEEFTLFDTPEILNQSSQIDMFPDGSNSSGTFVFNRTNTDETLWIIYDLRSIEPLEITDTITLNYSPQLIYFSDVFYSDLPIDSAVITSQPTNGSVLISSLNSFSILYEGDLPTNDNMVFDYDITINGITFHRTLNVIVNLLDA